MQVCGPCSKKSVKKAWVLNDRYHWRFQPMNDHYRPKAAARGIGLVGLEGFKPLTCNLPKPMASDPIEYSVDLEEFAWLI